MSTCTSTLVEEMATVSLYDNNIRMGSSDNGGINAFISQIGGVTTLEKQ